MYSEISLFVQATTSLLKMDKVFHSKANAVIHLPTLINFALNGDETAMDIKKMLNLQITLTISSTVQSDNPTACKDDLESPNKEITLFSVIFLDLQSNFSFVWSSSCYL